MKNHSERKTKSILQKIIFIIISIVALLIQLELLYFVLFESSKIRWLYALIVIMGIVCVIYLFDNKMNSSYKLIWTILILVFPFTGTMLFLLFGNGKTFPKRKSREIENTLKESYNFDSNKIEEVKSIDNIAYKHLKILNHGCSLPICTNTKVLFYSDISKKHLNMLEDLRNAKKYIFIEFFIMNNGVLFEQLLDVLYLKAKEGIEIKICYDDVGSKIGLKKSSFDKIRIFDNVTISKFASVGYKFDVTVNYRNHRKCVIIDGEIAYFGGDNLADEYANYKEKYGIWRDNAVKIEGEGVRNNILIFAQTWYLSTSEALDIKKYESNHTIETNNIVTPFGDGPTGKFNPACDLYTSITNNAKNYLYISTPYLIIDNEFINHLCNASISGVDVRILMPGVPDKKLIYLMSESHFGKLLKSGVKIYRYTPGFNHAKNYISDDLYAVVGSINIDYRSLYLHFENGVYIYNDEEILKMKTNFLNDLKVSEEITYESWAKRKWYKKIIAFILKMFAPLV